MSDDFQRYYRRATPETIANIEDVRLHFHGGDPTSADDFKKSLYVRSAYRHDPSFQQMSIQQQPDVLDRHAVRQKAMEVVFGDIRLDSLVAVQDRGTFTFTKGMSRNFLYENLSAGEKAAFDLMLDIVLNRAAFNDSLYCVDEPEAHLSTKLQGTLLREMYRLVPSNSQLWLATHSIGMVRTAQEMRTKHPGEVVFLDMGYGDDGEARDYAYALKDIRTMHVHNRRQRG